MLRRILCYGASYATTIVCVAGLAPGCYNTIGIVWYVVDQIG